MTTGRYVDEKRSLWLPEFEVDHEEVIGHWPIVIVTKWERNFLGERRYVETRSYRMVEPLSEGDPNG